MTTEIRTFRSYYGAKFWRLDQPRPLDWVISIGARGEYRMNYVGVLRNVQ